MGKKLVLWVPARLGRVGGGNEVRVRRRSIQILVFLLALLPISPLGSSVAVQSLINHGL